MRAASCFVVVCFCFVVVGFLFPMFEFFKYLALFQLVCVCVCVCVSLSLSLSLSIYIYIYIERERERERERDRYIYIRHSLLPCSSLSCNPFRALLWETISMDVSLPWSFSMYSSQVLVTNQT